jgi:hypothetical protein
MPIFYSLPRILDVRRKKGHPENLRMPATIHFHLWEAEPLFTRRLLLFALLPFLFLLPLLGR